MELNAIKSEKQYEQNLNCVDGMFDKGIKPDSPQGKKVEVCLVRIMDYEDKNSPFQYSFIA